MHSQIRKYRNAKNLTQKELSQLSGVNERTIQNYETKGIKKSTQQLMQLAAFFDVKVEKLISTEEELEKINSRKAVDLFDENGKKLNMTEIASYIKKNLEELKEEAIFRAILDIEALKILLKAKEGDEINVDKIG